jgi:peroxiredoxin Q/BCP
VTMIWLIGLLAVTLGFTAYWYGRPRGVAPAPGDAAPPFALAGSDGRVHTLEESRGRHVVLAWFPKAFTAGCAAECRSLRTEGPDLRGFDADYYAVSVDRAETNGRFATSLGVDFPILADPTREAARAYGVLGPLGVARRWTFYIGPDGRVQHVDRSVRTASAGADVAARLDALGARRR